MEVLTGTELSVADHGELAVAASAAARLQSFVDLAKVQIARRGRQLADAGDTSSAHVLIDEGRCTGADTKTADARDRVCGHLSGFETALADGDGHRRPSRSLAHHTKNLTDEERSDVAAIADELVADAAAQPAGLFDRTVKDRIDAIRNQHRPDTDVDELERQREMSKVKRWTDRDTGMRNTLVSLDPIRDETLWNVINTHLADVAARPGQQAATLRSSCKSKRSWPPSQLRRVVPRVSEIVVHTDTGTLCHGRHADTLCETADGAPVPVPTMQRLCCEAVIQAVIVNPDGTIDQVCAELRTANRQQRRMLEAMYTTCAHPHCTVAFSACRIHHIIWWTNGGKTVLPNLLPLCETHHHLVHEGGWNLTIDDQRHVTWTRPDGTVWHTDTGPNRRPDRSSSDRTSTDRCHRPPGEQQIRRNQLGPTEQRSGAPPGRSRSHRPEPQPTLL